MNLYRVTTCETIYEDYYVPADSPEEAKEKVKNEAIRAELRSDAVGGSDDMEIVGVQETGLEA